MGAERPEPRLKEILFPYLDTKIEARMYKGIASLVLIVAFASHYPLLELVISEQPFAEEMIAQYFQSAPTLILSSITLMFFSIVMYSHAITETARFDYYSLKKKLEGMLEQRKIQELDVIWTANASALGVVATCFDTQQHTGLYQAGLLPEIQGKLVQLTQVCTQYYLQINSPEDSAGKTKPQLTESITNLSKDLWAIIAKFYGDAKPEEVAQKMIEAFRKMDPYFLDTLNLVAKQQLPGEQAVWSRPRSNTRTHARALDTHEPPTVLATLDQISQCLVGKIGSSAENVLIVSEIRDAFPASLVGESLKLAEPKLSVAQTVFTQPITRGVDSILNDRAKLSAQTQHEIGAQQQQSIVLVINDPEDTVWVRNLLYDLLLQTGFAQVFIVAVNGGNIIRETNLVTELLALQRPENPIPVDSHFPDSPRSGLSIFQLNVSSLLASRQFYEHQLLRKQETGLTIHNRDLETMLMARNELESQQLLQLSERGEYQMTGADSHENRAYFLLAFGLISESEINQIGSEIGSVFYFIFLLEAIQYADAGLSEYQPPWENIEIWNKTSLLAMLKKYAEYEKNRKATSY